MIASDTAVGTDSNGNAANYMTYSLTYNEFNNFLSNTYEFETTQLLVESPEVAYNF